MYSHSLGIIYTDLSVPEVNQGLSNFMTANWNPLSQPFAWLSLCYGVSWVYVQRQKIVKTKEQWAEQEKKHIYLLCRIPGCSIYTNWFEIGKGVCQGYILSSCSFNLYAEYIMKNAGLDEAHAWIKTAERNINNLNRYADDTILMAENKKN